jgi:hypothetical protein
MPVLTPEQRLAVDQAIGREWSARIQNHVAVKAEVYGRLKILLDDGLEPSCLLVDPATPAGASSGLHGHSPQIGETKR